MIVERQDIDALLISALYGELTPSQESELTAHLASHPGDKLALEGLTATRDAVRASRILAVQVEPPQSISAMLIQEAARRAPRSPAEGEGWFGRFVRSFVQHPAMAAAAMLVLVVGIAAVVGRNKGNEFANEAADQSLSAPSAIAEKRGADRAEGGQAGSSMAFSQNAEPAPATVPSGAPSGSGSAFGGYADTGAQREANGKADDGKGDSVAVHVGNKIGMGVTLAEEHQQGTKTATADGIALDRRAAGPKDLASDEKQALRKESTRNGDDLQQKAKKQDADKNADLGDAEYYKGTTAFDATVTKPPGAGASGGAVAPAAPPPPPAQPSRQYATPPSPARSQAPTTVTTASAPQNAPASTPRVVAPVMPAATAPTPEPKEEASKQAAPAEEPAKKPAPAKVEAKVSAPPKVAAQTPAPAKTPAQAKVETKSLEEKPAEPPKPDVAKSDPTTEWAKAQHASLVAKARDNQCTAAADLAVTIENRAPSYYAQFVANDRDLKNCTSYITAAREKEAEKRASVERAKKSGAEPKAAKKADSAKTSTDK